MNTLTIKHGGSYSGTYDNIEIVGTDETPIVLSGITLNGPGLPVPGVNAHSQIIQSTSSTTQIVVQNSTFNTQPGHYTAMLWHWSTLDIEHNAFNGGGFLFGNSHATATSANVRYNRVRNFGGPGTMGQRGAVGGFQFQDCRMTGEICWNEIINELDANGHPLASVEDNISMMFSGGTDATHRFAIHDNFVSGGYSSSGSGIMLFDPGQHMGVTVGAHVDCWNNIVCNIRGQHITAAGSFDINAWANRAVCTKQYSLWGYQYQDWGISGPSTPTNLVGTQSNWHDNFSCVIFNGLRRDFSFVPNVTATNYVAGNSNEAAELALWQSRVAAGQTVVTPVVIGPQ